MVKINYFKTNCDYFQNQARHPYIPQVAIWQEAA